VQPDLADEPMISLQRLAERHRCRVPRVAGVVSNLESRREIRPQRTSTGRTFLSFRDAERVDAHLRR
jgi:hypothetical protein